MSQKMRIDKWLWSVRIFKSRTLAADAIKDGKVKVNEKAVKASSDIQEGDQLVVRKAGFDFQFKVLKIIPSRVGAPIAQTCYEDLTPIDELNKYKDWFIGKAGAEFRERGSGRPSKKDRRELDGFKDLIYEDIED